MTASHLVGAGIGLVIAALIGARIIRRQRDAKVERIIAAAHESGLVAEIEDWLESMANPIWCPGTGKAADPRWPVDCPVCSAGVFFPDGVAEPHHPRVTPTGPKTGVHSPECRRHPDECICVGAP